MSRETADREIDNYKPLFSDVKLQGKQKYRETSSTAANDNTEGVPMTSIENSKDSVLRLIGNSPNGTST